MINIEPIPLPVLLQELSDAKKEIERLREEKRQMALKYLAAEGQWIEETGRLRAEMREILSWLPMQDNAENIQIIRRMREIARAALGEKE